MISIMELEKMNNSREILFKTESLCPICLKKVSAERVKIGDKVYLEKFCSEHGHFSCIIWDGAPYMEDWVRDKIPTKPKKAFTEIDKGCPFDCGLCNDHRQHTCTALLEVTERCNLRCAFCFASSEKDNTKQDISLEKIKFWYKRLLEAGGPYNIQLSGGEPTVREDLPDIIKMGKEMGFHFIQLNTNGIKLADEKYCEALKESGLDSVFLQFDGVNDKVYEKLRGKKLLDIKIKAIENCNKFNIGVVLVPTLVREINLDAIGEIINFAINNIPTVRGVHFQPVSYFGRILEMPDNNNRITIPEVIREIEKQTKGKLKKEQFIPPGCENALCSFHGNFIYSGQGTLKAITKKSCCCSVEKAEEGSRKARSFVARNWSSPKDSKIKQAKLNNSQNEVMTWDDIIEKIKTYSFSISGMAFQDVWNIDLERVKDCCIHIVSEEGNLIPFCAYNVSSISGQTLYRKTSL